MLLNIFLAVVISERVKFSQKFSFIRSVQPASCKRLSRKIRNKDSDRIYANATRRYCKKKFNETNIFYEYIF